MKTRYPQKEQQRLSNFVQVVNDAGKEKELLVAVHVAMHSSIRNVDHLGALINKMTKENTVRIHRTKCCALIKHVIAPCLLDALLRDIGNEPYSLIIDESTDVGDTKYLCICVRYYSKAKGTITVDFLGLLEVEKATAVILYEALKLYLQKLSLDVKNVVGMGTDGGSNLCGVRNSVFALFKKDNDKIQLIRCICHSIHNAASQASEVLPANLDFMCREIYNWFHSSPLRKTEYQRLFKILNNDEKIFHNFVQLSTTRWLCRFNVIKIILEHYEELKVHFHTVVEKEKCFMARTLNEMLQDDVNYVYLTVLKPILFEINKVNLIFQHTNVEIGHAYHDVKMLIMLLARMVFKPVFLLNGLQGIIDSVENDLAYLDNKDIDLGSECYRVLSKLKIEDNKLHQLQIRIKQYIRMLICQLLKRLPTNLNHFKKLQCFSPRICLSQASKVNFKDLPFIDIYITNDVDIIENQYNSVDQVNWAEFYGCDVLTSSYKFWPTVLQHKNAGGALIFKELAAFVLLLMSLPISNAVVERVFSIMNATKTKVRNRMKTEMLSALLRIKVHLTSKCCNDFVCTKEMFERFNNSIYLTAVNSSLEEDENDCLVIEAMHENIPCVSLVE